ncbi:ATP-binding cassette domain-containing protein [Aquibium sp. A9E412]|uniref:ABC transporter ATP-binding protein n=1 Tax=Aquibium sp. A9E412 TaxID=2976767 RepID=UPI0025B26104|nr:oligopeptide/dipeptide ABC transporter ATP-binding protein [Aquibium sp. A9E412]MDN2566926.1 ATP-binding cassette domain-containing protein [Aquibium sp. A9E412]
MTAAETPLLSVRNLVKRYPLGGGLFSSDRRVVHAVEDVSFDIARGETFGLVGESGSGKSTISRVVTRLEDPTSGEIRLEGTEIGSLSERALRPYRSRAQMIFQDPYSSLDPRMKAGAIIEEPMVVQGGFDRSQRARRVAELLDMVGLPASARDRYPNEFSGGQRQRIGIARAIALNPRLVVADEPVSALDVSIQAQVVNLLEDLQAELGLSYLFIAHDLAVVRHIAHRVAVLYLGRVMEIASSSQLYAAPRHPYTRALMEAAPLPDPVAEASRESAGIEGEIPSAVTPPPGCVFSTRCPLASAECRAAVPPLVEVEPGHRVACIKVAPGAAAPA